MTASIRKGAWEFRLLENGRVESRCEAKKLEWADRTPQEIGLVDDHFAILFDCLNTVAFGIADPDEGIPAAGTLQEAMGPAVAPSNGPV